MLENQTFEVIEADKIFDVALKMKNDGYRLSQLCCTKIEDFELIYTFANGSEVKNKKVILPTDQTIESITGLFTYAYLYENEMKDLFGVKVMNINLDFKGTLYRTKEKTPFATREVKAKPTAKAAAKPAVKPAANPEGVEK